MLKYVCVCMCVFVKNMSKTLNNVRVPEKWDRILMDTRSTYQMKRKWSTQLIFKSQGHTGKLKKKTGVMRWLRGERGEGGH